MPVLPMIPLPPHELFRARLRDPAPWLALAPMQDLTGLPFWQLLTRWEGPDVFYTEYFRAHATSTLEKDLLRLVCDNPTGRPVVAQIAGAEISALVRTARALQQWPVAAIDLNLGCPAPIVCRKRAGGALLRDLPRVEALLAALRAAVNIPLTVKTRLGYADTADYARLLSILARSGVDAVVVHGRTVLEGYQARVHYDAIQQAVAALPCPVIANGDLVSAPQTQAVLAQTGARGAMIGRGAVRNPWIFRQIRQQLRGAPVVYPTGRDVFEYLAALYHTTWPVSLGEHAQVERMKKYLAFVGIGVEPTGQFLHRIRRVNTGAEFFAVCAAFLAHDQPLRLEPFPALGIPG